MEDKRHHHDMDRPFWDKFSEIAGALICIATIVYTVLVWSRMPDVIATHFDASGNPDGYGGRGGIILLLVLMVGMYVVFLVVSRIPRTFNYVVKITDENRQIQQGMAQTFLRIMGLQTVVLVGFICWSSIQGAISGNSHLNVPFMFGLMGIMFGSIGYYMYLSIKHK